MRLLTLVTHFNRPELGIGVVSKILKSGVKVTFNQDLTLNCVPTILREVDVSNAITIPLSEFSDTTESSQYTTVIFGNHVWVYDGGGWQSTYQITLDDLKRYPLVVEEL